MGWLRTLSVGTGRPPAKEACTVIFWSRPYKVSTLTPALIPCRTQPSAGLHNARYYALGSPRSTTSAGLAEPYSVNWYAVLAATSEKVWANTPAVPVGRRSASMALPIWRTASRKPELCTTPHGVIARLVGVRQLRI